MHRIAAVVVFVAGTYLVGLGIMALVRPDRARRFLSAFASTARLHFVELGVRLLVGFALVGTAPQMRFPALFTVIGWIVIGTTVVLFAVPWRVHQRFASWSVPIATRNMLVFAFGSLAAGAFVLVSLLVGDYTLQ